MTDSTSSRLARQWAVRLPDGSLFAPAPPPPVSPFPWMLPEEPKPPRVAIFDHEADARRALEGLRKHAQALRRHQTSAPRSSPASSARGVTSTSPSS